jgi:hypothetical protein
MHPGSLEFILSSQTRLQWKGEIQQKRTEINEEQRHLTKLFTSFKTPAQGAGHEVIEGASEALSEDVNAELSFLPTRDHPFGSSQYLNRTEA